MKKVLVTGGFGFIGSHIVDKFIHNNYELVLSIYHQQLVQVSMKYSR
ncbi:NAD-dependent epimerase/dehydratase family protein [Bacillus pseudomycoides]|nr:NAD-dependent epimerase/dehydratase family protein [Bacillus pseudomycoides]